MSKISKTNWENVRHQIKKSNRQFYELIEQVSPSNELPLYLVEYPYGERIGNKDKVYLPKDNGQLYVLGSTETPPEIMQDLSYGKDSCPLGMILENFCEWYYEDPLTLESFPFFIQGPGSIFNQQIIFNEDLTVDNNTLSVSSGSKSLFMLPYIGSQSSHERLKSSLSVSLPAPKTIAEHFSLFQEIVAGSSLKNQWVTRVLYFSEAWINQIRNHREWLAVKFFFSENLRKRFSSDFYSSFYNELFLTNKSINRFRPTPFLVDTAKHVFSIFMGQGLGFKPAVDHQLLPLQQIQEAYIEHYQLSYAPTIMVPGILGQNNDSVYYSLQHPGTNINTFKIRMNNSTYRELVALKGILMSYRKSFISESGICFGSDLYYACKNINLDFYHNKPSDPSHGILNSKRIPEADERFLFSSGGTGVFSADAKFLRGCIRIST